jgi:hypothetical protein
MNGAISATRNSIAAVSLILCFHFLLNCHTNH